MSAPHFIHVINSLRVGGAEKLLITMSREMQQRGIPLTIVTLRPNVPACQLEIESTGTRVVEFPGRKLRDLKRLRALNRFLEDQPVSLIHTHLTMANILGQFLAWRHGIPAVTSLHNVHMRSQANPVQHRLETWLLNNKAAAVIAVGDKIASAHADRLPKQNIEVIPNAVSLSAPALNPLDRQEVRRELTGDHPERPLLLAVGRLEQQKAFGDLLEALAIHHQNKPETHLAIAGDGPQRPLLQQKCAELGLADRVKLLGVRHDIPRLLAAADLYVSSSHWEGLPVSLLEAMGAGLPVVVTRVGEIPQIVNEQHGVVVNPQQPVDLAAAIDSLIDQPPQRVKLGQNGRDMITSKYGVEQWVDRLLALYETCLTTSGRRL
ncbi:MAG: glycosyltransferase [Ardenticatenaceae bacterium]|nr:glycosyltransferase [Ardenticatenaceae bacterium]